MSENNKKHEYFIEHFVKDKDLIREYKELHDPIKKRGKYCLVYSSIVMFLSFKYIQNLQYYTNKFFPNRGKGFMSLMWISSIHSLTFSFILLAGNLVVLGINPVTHIRKFKALDEKMLASDPNSNMTWTDFLDVFNKASQANINFDGEEKIEKKETTNENQINTKEPKI